MTAMSGPMLSIGVPTPDGQSFVIRQWFVTLDSAEALATQMGPAHVEQIFGDTEILGMAEVTQVALDAMDIPTVINMRPRRPS